ncbi:DUF4328 domain-containing protein [Streptomyces sp. J2-1]|uniref:DUF4328 domain-containing protein n=1 Tax=Streptomyces corallincola TaxID=2851888 RepID=UPI001C387C4F|nr:DUF4328 domain-containing protein [Streptomyces corallincola]MBV2356269.1 DUF4328 domain-containing protein [Streptomyces corallincola]
MIPDSPVKAPWASARCAQAALAAATVADVWYALFVRSRPAGSGSVPPWAMPLYVRVTVVVVVLFLVWFARCRRNAAVLSAGRLPVSRVLAIVAWLIPLMNLWVPRGLVLQVHGASSRGAVAPRDARLVNVWWGAWVGHGVLSLLGGAVFGQERLPVSLAISVLVVVAGVLGILVVQRVTSGQARAVLAPPPVTAHAAPAL